MAPSGIEFLRAPTPTLRALLEQYQQQLPDGEYQAFVAYLRNRADEYRRELARYPAGPERARAAHRLLDAEISAIRGIRPTCGRGCTACCHLEVEVVRDEGELLAEIIASGHPIDEARLAAQAGRARQGPEWSTPLGPENRCVFLAADGSCSVYEDRPGACRKHLVVSAASECSAPGGRPESRDGAARRARPQRRARPARKLARVARQVGHGRARQARSGRGGVRPRSRSMDGWRRRTATREPRARRGSRPRRARTRRPPPSKGRR